MRTAEGLLAPSRHQAGRGIESPAGDRGKRGPKLRVISSKDSGVGAFSPLPQLLTPIEACKIRGKKRRKLYYVKAEGGEGGDPAFLPD